MAPKKKTKPKKVSRSVRHLTSFAANSECATARHAIASGSDIDRIFRGTRYEVDFGQSPFAIARGHQFEEYIGPRNGYQPVVDLLNEHLSLDIEPSRVLDLRKRPESPKMSTEDFWAYRAKETTRHLEALLRDEDTGYDLIAGAVMETDILGETQWFEADAVAFRAGDVLRVVEMKSFPTVDGRCDPDKAGSAFDQAAAYIFVLREMAEKMGLDPTRISDEALLITPKNVGFTPTLHRHPVGGKLARSRVIFEELRDEIAATGPMARLPEIDSAGNAASSEDARVASFEIAADRLTTSYTPQCLGRCGAAKVCRARALANGDPMVAGQRMARELVGIVGFARAEDLAEGATPDALEAAAAEKLQVVHDLVAQARGPK